MSQLFFITGVSTGLGLGIARAALDHGHRVVGTVRKASDKENFEKLKPGSAHAYLMDVTHEDQVLTAVQNAEREVGPIDVLINNAGYGQEGTIEESSLQHLRDQFEVNVFGVVSVIKAVLPLMRARRAGHIINVTSMGGLMTIPGVGFYHGSKFALEGITGSLAKEVKSFGIFVTALEPGQFRTDWAGRSMVRAPRSISDYDELFGPIRAAREAKSGKQAGDPYKAGLAVLKLIASPNPPTHLLLGADAIEFVRRDRQILDAEITAWESVSRSTNFE